MPASGLSSELASRDARFRTLAPRTGREVLASQKHAAAYAA
jgi:hypothetical protein